MRMLIEYHGRLYDKKWAKERIVALTKAYYPYIICIV